MAKSLSLELMTALLEYLNLFDWFVKSAAVKASLLPQNVSMIPDSYYAWNYAGIIASSLLTPTIIIFGLLGAGSGWLSPLIGYWFGFIAGQQYVHSLPNTFKVTGVPANDF